MEDAKLAFTYYKASSDGTYEYRNSDRRIIDIIEDDGYYVANDLVELYNDMENGKAKLLTVSSNVYFSEYAFQYSPNSGMSAYDYAYTIMELADRLVSLTPKETIRLEYLFDVLGKNESIQQIIESMDIAQDETEDLPIVYINKSTSDEETSSILGRMFVEDVVGIYDSYEITRAVRASLNLKALARDVKSDARLFSSIAMIMIYDGDILGSFDFNYYEEVGGMNIYEYFDYFRDSPELREYSDNITEFMYQYCIDSTIMPSIYMILSEEEVEMFIVVLETLKESSYIDFSDAYLDLGFDPIESNIMAFVKYIDLELLGMYVETDFFVAIGNGKCYDYLYGYALKQIEADEYVRWKNIFHNKIS